MDRPEIIRIIESDERAHNDLTSFQFGYMRYETLLHRFIVRWHNGRINREFIDIAQSIVDGADNANL